MEPATFSHMPPPSEGALRLGYMTDAEFDAIVRPETMIGAGLRMAGQGGNNAKVNGVSGADGHLLGGWDASAAQKPRKRSLSIAGHRTSISLEEPFWDGLRQAAAARGVSIAAMVAAIDAVRADASLSSAIRVFVLSQKDVPAEKPGRR